MRLLKLLLVLFVCAAGPAVAGPLEDVIAAYNVKDFNSVDRLIRTLADQGNARDQYNIGVMCMLGWGASWEGAKTVSWFRKAADQDLAVAQHAPAFMYQYGQGADDQYIVGYSGLCKLGQNWRQNEAEAAAVFWIRKAADQDLAAAQHALGFMYQYGHGVLTDVAAAAAWYRKAANQGVASAQFLLGLIYDKGWGVRQDDTQAYMWLNLAVANAPREKRDFAVSNRDRVAARLPPSQIIEGAEAGAFSSGPDTTEIWRPALPLAAEPWEDATAALTQDNYETAYVLFGRRADHIPADVQFDLGRMHERAKNRRNDARAIFWYRKAADQGHADAQLNLGLLHFEGRGTALGHYKSDDGTWYWKADPPDYREAEFWFRKAANQGNAYAQQDLGLMYVQEKVVRQDDAQAYMWLSLAAANLAGKEDRDQAVKNRDIVSAKMTPAQIAEAQKLAREWKPKPER